MLQVEGQVCRRGVTLRRLRRQATQHHFLQPGRQLGPQAARRGRVHPEALAQAARGLRLAERQLTGQQLVEHDADGKDIAARIAAHTHHLFRGHPGRRAHGPAQLFGQQVREMRVARQTEIEQHHAAIVAHQHVGRLEVQVHGVLLVQAVHGMRHGHAQFHHGVDRRALGLLQPVLQRAPGDVLHHQVRHALKVAGSDEARHMRAGQRLQDLVLNLEAHDVLGPVARSHARNLHHHGETGLPGALRVGDVVDVRHAAVVEALPHDKAIQLASGLQQFHRPSSSRSAKNPGRPARRIASAAAWWLYSTR